MKKLHLTVQVIVLVVFFLGIGILGETSALAAERGGAQGAAIAAKGADEGWETVWKNTVEAAKKEGKVSVYANWGSALRAELGKAFKEKFGIDIEFTAVGKGSELAAKLVTEDSAGLRLADAVGSGATTMLINLKPNGLLGPLEPMLILPEVTNPRLWLSGKIPYIDRDRTAVGLVAGYSVFVTRNTSLIKEGEIKSYHDLLEPKWKGKIVMNDPTTSGTGVNWVHLMVKQWGMEKTKDYLRQLVKQEPELSRNLRLQVEWLARGKCPVGLALNPDNVLEFKKQGAPVDFVRTKEGGRISNGAGALAITSKQLPHPNAAKVLVNWIMSKEGGSIVSCGIHLPSARVDVVAQGLEDLVARPGERVIIEAEGDIKQGLSLFELAREALGPLFK